MKRVTFVLVGFVAVFIMLILTKPDNLNKNKKSDLVFQENKIVKTFK